MNFGEGGQISGMDFPLKAQGLNNLVRDINMLHDFFQDFDALDFPQELCYSVFLSC